MTVPDHTPYLRPGVDLVTTEDVLEWLEEYSRGRVIARRYPETVIEDACEALSLRLDRERRQACRRAALAMWRRYRASLDSDTDWDDMSDAWGRSRQQERYRADALAFRAAARAR